MANIKDVPRLGDWITLSEAAALLGRSRQNVHQLVEKDVLTTVVQVGRKPVYLVKEDEVLSLFRARADALQKSREDSANQQAD